MLISELIEQLERVKDEDGDLEVTMQGSLLEDGYKARKDSAIVDVFESTVCSMRVYDKDDFVIPHRLRLFWQT